jgi:adenine deaminase
MAAAGLALLIIAHLADYTTFLVMVHRHGTGAELNPIVTSLISEWGLSLLTVAKFSTVLLLASVVIIVGRTRPRMAAGVLTIGILVGGLGALSNLATI